MTDISFIEKLEGLREQSRSEEDKLPAIYSSLFKRISPENFRRIINHAIRNYNTYKDEDYHYVEKSPIGANIHDPYFLACTYEIYRHDNGELALVIQTKSKTSTLGADKEGKLTTRVKVHTEKARGSDKGGGTTSFCIDAGGLTEYFTLVAREEDSIKRVEKEQKILRQINNPFIVNPLFGQRRYKHVEDGKKSQPRISITAPKAVCDGGKINFESLTDFLVGVKSLALGVQAINEAGYIHQDLKLRNILLMPNGIIKITDFGIAIPNADHENSDFIDGTPGSLAPEVLASIIAEQRNELLKNSQLTNKERVILKESPIFSLEMQIAAINHIGDRIQVNVTRRYGHHFCLQDSMFFNQNAMQTWDRWQAQDHDLLQKIKLPNPQQDMWSLGSMLLQLLNEIPRISSETAEGKFLSKLIRLIQNKIVDAPPETRLTIDRFIKRFDKLLESVPEITEVNDRIQRHIREFSEDQQKSKIDLTAQTPASVPIATVPAAMVVTTTDSTAKKPSSKDQESKVPSSQAALEPSSHKPSVSSAPTESKPPNPVLTASITQPPKSAPAAPPAEIKEFLTYYKNIHDKCASSNSLSKALINHSIFAENRFAKRDLVKKIGYIFAKYGDNILIKEAQTEIDDLIIRHIGTVGNNNLDQVLRGLSVNYRIYCKTRKVESFAEYVTRTNPVSHSSPGSRA